MPKKKLQQKQQTDKAILDSLKDEIEVLSKLFNSSDEAEPTEKESIHKLLREKLEQYLDLTVIEIKE